MISNSDYLAMLAKLDKNSLREPPAADDAVSEEIPLHYEIIKWCRAQYPQVPYIHARTDKRSGIAKGACDFTIFWKGKALCLELKSRTGKLSPDQVVWKLLMERQGFPVVCVRSLTEFLALVA